MPDGAVGQPFDQAEESEEDIRPIFEPGGRICTIVLNQVIYPDLRVKRINDLPKGSAVLVVLIPCAKQLGHNLMVAYDIQAVWEFNHPIYEQYE